MTKHAFLPTTIVSDKGPAFMSHVFKKVAGVFVITVKDATTKQVQTIGMLERSYGSIKQALKIATATGERRSLWHKYFSIAVRNYDTSYHASIGCESSRTLHGRIHYKILGSLFLKKCIRPPKMPTPNSFIAQHVLEQLEMTFQDIRINAI